MHRAGRGAGATLSLFTHYFAEHLQPFLERHHSCISTLEAPRSVYCRHTTVCVRSLLYCPLCVYSSADLGADQRHECFSSVRILGAQDDRAFLSFGLAYAKAICQACSTAMRSSYSCMQNRLHVPDISSVVTIASSSFMAHNTSRLPDFFFGSEVTSCIS